MPLTPGGAPYPSPSDAPNPPQHLQALAEWADQHAQLRFPTRAARDAAISSPLPGMIAWVDELAVANKRTEYISGGWRDYDTGWRPFAYAAGMVAYSGGPAARRQGDRVQLRGSIARSNNADLTSGLDIATIASGLRPTVQAENQTGSTEAKTAGSSCRVDIGLDGVITPVLHVAVRWVCVDGITYLVN